MRLEPGHDVRALVWWLMSNVELRGSIEDIKTNGDVIIRSDLLLQHPNEPSAFQLLYGGVPRSGFEKKQRVRFKLKADWNEPKWRERGGRFPPCVVTSSIRADEVGSPLAVEGQISELLSMAGFADEASRIVESARQEAAEISALTATRVAEADDYLAYVQKKAEELRAEADAQLRELQERESFFEERGGQRFLEALALEDETVRGRRSLKVDAPADVVATLREAADIRGLTLAPAVIRRALVGHVVAALTGQLVVFGGPPGSGKTSLATWLPSAIDMEVSTLAVRPGWLDAADLLGYFDAREDRFVPGPFLDAVLAAAADSDSGTCRVAVLDEMNIARIENYGADLLSQLEKAHEPGEEGVFRLYSPAVRRDIDRRLIEALASNALDLDQIRQRAQRLTVVPPDLRLPLGLIVSGTLNNDNTTETLSPKVIDRSFAIRVPAHVPQLRARSTINSVVLSIDADFIEMAYAEIANSGSDANVLWDVVRSLVDDLHVPDVHLSNRTAKVVSLVPAIATLLGLAVEQVLDDVVAAKLLPWIRYFRGQDRDAEDAVRVLCGRLREAGLADSAIDLEHLLETSTDLVQYLR